MIECIDRNRFLIEIKFILKQKSFHIANIEREGDTYVHNIFVRVLSNRPAFNVEE